MPNLYIIAGCNGAGKTTASYTILPEILHCREFVNADSIAAGLSPFNAESVALEAGRIMLHRINQLMEEKADFAFETTLSTRSYASLVKKAQEIGYQVTLLFFWLNSPELAIERVAKRVSHGGHNIPVNIIERRYCRGLHNLMKMYIGICNNWLIVSNMDADPDIIAEGGSGIDTVIKIPIFGRSY
ncbi:zeta toxin family protein [Paraflavitalea speifideaquila]|uniref:zeta toxin family protein n=1 Tax=Paraflavitalea speifideaquila TaxID=3076558 RepID=UPI0028ED5F28|nr:zeta toxin family protein [Paraflavitalea speifideiaquila]